MVPPRKPGSGNGRRSFLTALRRSRAELVPPAFQFLWERVRFLVCYGGRAAAKSWSIVRVLLVQGHEKPLRILCAREIQGSIRESAYRLLADQIQILQLDTFYEIQSDNIQGKNGTRFYFEGLRYNASKIRSYEGVDIVWVEEAQNVSELSWETLLPTIRKAGSRFFISFNPMTRDDPVSKRFVESARRDVVAKRVSWRDNPYLSPEAIAEKDWLERTDPDAYRHVWEGEPRSVSDALILKGKYAVEAFEVSPAWAGPYHGLDYGFSRDPTAAVRCYIDDTTRTLFVTHEFWALGTDIDALPGELEAAIPGIGRHVVFADAARPESTSYLARNGIPSARSAEMWRGSVDDGLAYLRSFAHIVIDPACRHLLDECNSYSFKTDRLTNVPLPEPLDAHNHLIDALRYALSPLIRNQPSGGYLERAALLVDGEPVTPADKAGRAQRVFCTFAICDRPGTALGVVYWALFPNYGYLLHALDFDLIELGEVSGEWLGGVCARAQELRAEWDAVEFGTMLWVEEGPLFNGLGDAFALYVVDHGLAPLGRRPLFDMGKIESRRLRSVDGVLLATLDQRMNDIRAALNGGGLLKFARSAYLRQTTHRSVSANHLWSQLLGYRPGVADAAAELVAAVALAVLAEREGDFRMGATPAGSASVPRSEDLQPTQTTSQLPTLTATAEPQVPEAAPCQAAGAGSQ